MLAWGSIFPRNARVVNRLFAQSAYKRRRQRVGPRLYSMEGMDPRSPYSPLITHDRPTSRCEGPESRLPPLQRALGLHGQAWAALDPAGAAAGAFGVPAPDARAPQHVVAWATRCAAGLCNALGRPLQPTLEPPRDEDYEHAVLHRGLMAFRAQASHDWFNLLTWRLWPLSKAALNLRAGLHLRAALRACQGAPGQRIPRDLWRQRLANLDEGGCVVREDWLATAALDDHGVYRAKDGPLAGRDLWLFGHGALELIHDQPLADWSRLRLFVVPVPALEDEALARRILTLDPSLEPMLSPEIRELSAQALPFFCAALRFAAADPFAPPFRSVAFPYP